MKPYPEGAIKRARRLRQDMTWTEKRLWRELRKLDLSIRRQVPIGPYIVDFASVQHRLVIEIDGGIHNLPDVQARDGKRAAWLQSEGYRVVRFRDLDVFNETRAVVEQILALLPPQGGKGRDGGVRAAPDGLAQAAAPPQEPFAQTVCAHPQPCPSPLEGEGFRDLS